MVTRVIKLMYSEIKGLHQAAYLLAFFAFGSQMLALVRDRLLAFTFGAGSELDLYYAAFRIPDILFALFASVLSVYVLLPFVTKARSESGVEAGATVLGQMFTVFLIVYSLVAVVLFLVMPYITSFLFPGFSAEADTITTISRILLLQPLLLGISSLYGVVTQLSQRFVLYAISPLIYNCGIIIGIIVLYPWLGIYGLAVGVVLGALGHMAIQAPLIVGSELRFGLRRKIDWSLVRRVLLFAFPRALTLSLHQIVLLIFISLASLMAAGSVSVFQFAFNLQSVPLAIIGMSYSVAAFPVLADLFAKQQREAFCLHVLTAFRHIIFWSLPIIALVIILRAHIVRVVLGTGAFNWNDTRLTAAMLALFVVSLVGQSLMMLLVRTFYAGGNTRIPLYIALLCAGISLSAGVGLLSLYNAFPSFQLFVTSLFRLELVVGAEVLVLAMAFTLGTLVEALLLLIFAARLFGFNWFMLSRQFFEALTAALVAALFAYSALIFIVPGVNQNTFIGISLQGGVAALFGIFGAIFTYYALGSRELTEIYQSFRSRVFKTDVIAPQSETP